MERLTSRLLLMMAFCLLFAVGCEKSMPTEPALPRTPVPTPTPVPPPNIAGVWRGTFKPTRLYFFASTCNGLTVLASATFLQDGAVVSGNVISASCAEISGHIQGSLRGTSFEGTFTSGGVSHTVSGRASDRDMDLRIGGGLAFGGRLLLDR